MQSRQAGELLRVIGARYAAMGRYRDTGRVLRSGADRPLLTFQTRFARDVGLRFEYTRGDSTTVVSRPLTDADGLMEDLAAATGVSAGVASTIPALLLPAQYGEGDWSLLRLTDVRGAEPPSRDLRGSGWTWIAGGGWRGQPLRLAIDPESLLIHRIEDPAGSARGATITEYEPETEPPITAVEIFGSH